MQLHMFCVCLLLKTQHSQLIPRIISSCFAHIEKILFWKNVTDSSISLSAKKKKKNITFFLLGIKKLRYNQEIKLLTTAAYQLQLNNSDPGVKKLQGGQFGGSCSLQVPSGELLCLQLQSTSVSQSLQLWHYSFT